MTSGQHLFENQLSKMWVYVNWIQPKLKPKFDKSFLSFQVPECSKYPTVIGQLRFDGDYPDALFYLNSAGIPFKIEPGGFLTLNRQLDYEKQRFYTFQVEASIKGVKIEAEVKVKVRVILAENPKF